MNNGAEFGGKMSFDQLTQYFRDHQENFARDHYREYVIIHNQSVAGFYDDQLEAYLEAKEKFQPGEFLIRQCIKPEEEKTVVFHSRVGG
ncbi:MAG: hypothetical protein OXE94_06110 [Aestuariivita sp.]|nr:hypothetical protein [Aestuariivita sp.]MCY4201450.1 hypothetical protein [Aestuariivita sp.]